ncbi:MAG: putative baseplate assembly protein [Methanosarcinales archaeon]|nr:putative baseplate assembly protein [Methanosarcinales archaeon]
MPLPIPELDDKRYEELLKEAKARIPVYAPEWTDYNAHDPGITLIELFAWLSEMQIYRLNRITDRSYMKFLKLMGIGALKTARPSVVDVTFSCNQQYMPVRAGTEVAAMDMVSGEEIIFETLENLDVIDAEIKAVLSFVSDEKNPGFTDKTAANENDNVYFYAFRYKPETGDAMYLGFDKSLTGREAVIAFYLSDKDVSKTGRYAGKRPVVYPSAELCWEYYARGDRGDQGRDGWSNRLEITDETRHLAVSGKIRIRIEEEMKQTIIDDHDLFWLRCRVKKTGYEIPPKIDFIVPNTVSAIQRKTFKDCRFCGSGLPDLCLELPQAPVIEGTPRVGVREGDAWVEWNEVWNLDSSKPGDRHYKVDMTTGRVRFGDGINGRIPPDGKDKDNIAIFYRSGGGVRGNVAAGTINRVAEKLDELVTVENMRAASGGAEAETLADAMIRARKDLRTTYRAVTSADYESLAMNTPGIRVARARAIPGYHPDQKNWVPGIVTVVVVPESPYAEPEPSQGFLMTVHRHLDQHRLLTTEVFVVAPEYVEVTVAATVIIKPENNPGRVRDDVEMKLASFVNPITGGRDGKGWRFGRAVYRSEICELIDGVAGVDYITDLTLRRDGRDQPCDILIAPHSLVFHSTEFPSEINVEEGGFRG